MKKLFLLVTLLALLTSACGIPQPVATSSPIASPSPLPTETPALPATPLQPSLTATPIFVEGVLIIKINVRSGPGTGYDSLGQLDGGGVVKIITRDSQGIWYKILYPSAPQGYGWVAAQYVTVPAGTMIPLDATPTPAGPTGRVIQRVNVRSGPGTTFETLGLLEPGSLVFLTGKNTTASWFQIEYPTGPGGRSWVTSQYVQADSAAGLPVLNDFGSVVTPGTTGTPSGSILHPTPTVGPAYADGDSSVSPAIRVSFSGAGTHKFLYSSQVSTPDGDAEDWVEFQPYTTSGINARLTISLACTGNGRLAVELWHGSTLLSDWGTLACGDVGRSIQLPAGQVYLMRLTPIAGDGLQLLAYTLSIQNNP